MPKVWVPALGRALTFPEGTSTAVINRYIQNAIASEGAGDEGILANLGAGFKEGFAAAPRFLGGTMGFIEDVIPGKQQWFEDQEQKWKGRAESMQSDVEADTLWEEVARAAAQAPGTIISMLPMLAAGAGIVAASPLTGAAAAVASPAIGMGLFSALSAGGEGLDESAKAGAIGAAEGAAFGGVGRVASSLGPVASRLAGAGGAAAIGGTSSALQGADPMESLAHSITLGVLSGLTHKTAAKVDKLTEAKRYEAAPRWIKDEKLKAAWARGFISDEQMVKEFGKESTPARQMEMLNELRTKEQIDPTEATGRISEMLQEKDYAPDLEALGQEPLPMDMPVPKVNGFSMRAWAEHGNSSRAFIEKALADVDKESISWKESEQAAKSQLSEQTIRDLNQRVGNGKATAVVEAGKGLAGDLTRRVAALEKKIQESRAANVDPHEMLKLEMEYDVLAERATLAFADLYGVASEAGRALRIMAKPPEGMSMAERAVYELGRKKALSKDIFQKLMADPNNPEHIAHTLRTYFNPKLTDYAYEAWINGLLSGVPTHVVNTASNLGMQIMSTMERGASVPADILRSAMTGAPRERFAAEVFGEGMGWWRGLATGMKEFARVLKDEYYGHESMKIEHYERAIPGKTGKAVRMPSRLLKAGDLFFKALGGQREGWVQAYRMAKSEGAKDLGARAAEIMQNPPKKLLEAMRAAGEEQTFTTPLGAMGSQAMRMRDQVPTGRWIVPFMRTPTNIMKEALRRTPFNARMYRMAKQGFEDGRWTAEFADEVTKATMGTALGFSIFSLAESGHITGGGPSDPAEYRNLRETGWQPYSIALGDGTFLSFQRLEPLSTIFGMAADLAELEDVPVEERANKIAAAVKENLTNKTFLLGLENLAKAWAEPNMFFQSFAQSLEGSVVPAWMANAARASDPTIRDASWSGASGVLSPIVGRIPGMTQKLEPKYSSMGDVRERTLPYIGLPGPQSAGNIGKYAPWLTTYVSPVYASQEDKTKVVQKEFDRLRDFEGMPPSLPSKTKRVKLQGLGSEKVDLTDAEYRVFNQYHKMAERELSMMIGSEGYQQLADDEYKAMYLRRVYDKYRRAANAHVKQLVINRITMQNWKKNK